MGTSGAGVQTGRAARALKRILNKPTELWDKRRRRVLAALILSAVLLALSGVAARGGATTITFSEDLAPAEVPAMLKLLDRFQSETGIKVRLNTGRNSDLQSRLEGDRIARKSSIHLFGQDNPVLYELVEADVVADLSKEIHLDKDAGFVEEKLRHPAPLDESEFAEREFFLPFRSNLQLFYVNHQADPVMKDTKTPTDLDELRSMAGRQQEMSKEGKLTLSLDEGPPSAVTIAEFILTADGQPLRLNDDGSIHAFLSLQSMLRDGTLSKQSLHANYDTQIDYLNDRRSLMAQNWSFTSAVFAQQGTLTDFSVHPGWAENQVHVIGGDMLGIPKLLQDNRSKGTEEKSQWRAAVGLAKFLMSKESQVFLAKENGWLPIRDDAYREAIISGDLSKTLKAAHAALTRGQVWMRPNTEEWHQAECGMAEARQRILVDGLEKNGDEVRAILNEIGTRVLAKTECPQ